MHVRRDLAVLTGREPADRPERLKPLQEGLRSRAVRRVELAGVAPILADDAMRPLCHCARTLRGPPFIP